MKFQVQSIWINTTKLAWPKYQSPKISLANNLQQLQWKIGPKSSVVSWSLKSGQKGAPKRWARNMLKQKWPARNLGSPRFQRIFSSFGVAKIAGAADHRQLQLATESLCKGLEKSSDRPPNGGCLRIFPGFHPKIIQRTRMKMMENHTSQTDTTGHPKHKRPRNLGHKEKLMEIFGGPSTWS